MKILIIEDSDVKSGAIQQQISTSFGSKPTDIHRAKSMATATRSIYETQFDLIIMDLMIPDRDDQALPRDVSEELLGTKLDSALNKSTPAIAITGFDDLIDQQIRKFSDAGVSVVLYDSEAGNWKNSLSLELSKYKELCRYDFIIICALEKERAAYAGADCSLSAPINQHGIDCVPIQIGRLNGAIIKPVRMGPIEAAIATSKSIERFRPKIVAMSGICAGFASEVSLGTLLIPELCWDYQTGKWTDDGFIAEPYAVSIPAQVRGEIATFIAGRDEQRLGSDLYCDPIQKTGAHMGVFVTGSSVISCVEKMDNVKEQHRKLSGLDMEMTAVFQAASGSTHPVLFFGAKTVVDLGDNKKNDSLHTPGATYSARFVVEMIKKLNPA